MGDISALLDKLQTQYFFLIYYSKYWLSHTANFDQAKSNCWGSWKQLVLTDDNALAAKPWTVEGWQALDPRVQHSIVDSEHHALLGLSVLEHSLCATADLSTLVLDKCSDRLTHSMINIRGSTKRFWSAYDPVLIAAAQKGCMDLVKKLLEITKEFDPNVRIKKAKSFNHEPTMPIEDCLAHRWHVALMQAGG